MDQANRRHTSIPSAVRIGGMSKSELLQALREHDVQLNQAAEALFEDRRFTTLSRYQVIEITALSVSNLGFGEGATYGQLTARALESGLVECPLELGPHLRLQFQDQPEGANGLPTTHGRAPPESIIVASSPLDDSVQTAKGFYLRRAEGVLWLRGYWSWPGHIWSPKHVLVFSRDIAAKRAGEAGVRQKSRGVMPRPRCGSRRAVIIRSAHRF
jgi:hypothetical protein